MSLPATQLKPGFIFITISDSEDRADYPSDYLTSYYGGMGYLGKLDTADSKTINGFEPISLSDYLAA